MRRATGLSDLASSLSAFGRTERHTVRKRHSQPERPGDLIGGHRRRPTGFQVSQPLRGDATVLSVDHRLVALDELGWHDRGRTLMSAAASDVGDLTAECGTAHGVGELVPGLADG